MFKSKSFLTFFFAILFAGSVAFAQEQPKEKKCVTDCNKECCVKKEMHKCGSECKDGCTAKKAETVKCKPDCKKECCSKKEMHKCGPECKVGCTAKNAEMNNCKSDCKSEKCTATKKEEMTTATIWNKFCPVGLENVDPKAPTVSYKGKTIGFCCPGCESKFVDDPESYLKNLSEDGQSVIKKG